jgi:hypothetical protein
MQHPIEYIFSLPIKIDSLRGMMVGLAMGDALGAPHKFSRQYTYSGKLDFPSSYRNQFLGTR